LEEITDSRLRCWVGIQAKETKVGMAQPSHKDIHATLPTLFYVDLTKSIMSDHQAEDKWGLRHAGQSMV
jgi:hypothetical protein